ncbi:ferritin-like domain-containing protein [Streptomyces diastatochromogenes]|uniref:ferritin-like domain-containing protein n=1 Tax=Streptomyces diastatochromogenes TaxID=42236 RepID=UPI0036836FE2
MTETVLDYESDAIRELMEVEEDARTDDWLQKSLQQAIMLELATLPPYLCGWWSVIEKTEEDKKISSMIREIIFDEMSHLGHVCNLLTTIGGSPIIADKNVVAPYPCQLPGGVRPNLPDEDGQDKNLTVYLSGLTRKSVEMYSRIEAPAKPLAKFSEGNEEKTYPSIGEFYDAILKAFQKPGVPFTGWRQLVYSMDGHGKGNSLFAIKNLADAEKAIKIIQEQGEGTHAMPENPHDGYEGELAHYYTFRQLYRGKKLIKVQEQPPKWDFEGADIKMPGAHPMGVVPKGGWAGDKKTAPDAKVQKILDDFNSTFSSMLRSLEKVWQQDSPKDAEKHMSDAEAEMYNLGGPALQLMEKPLPNDPAKRYGPEFLYIPKKP